MGIGYSFWFRKEFIYLFFFFVKNHPKFWIFYIFIFYWKIAGCSISLPCFNNRESWIVNHLDSIEVFYGWLDFSSLMVFSYPWQLNGAYLLSRVVFLCLSRFLFCIPGNIPEIHRFNLLLHCKSLWCKTYVSHAVVSCMGGGGPNISMVMKELNHHF